MKLVDFAKKMFAKGPELWEDSVTVTTGNSTIKRDTARLRRCSLGIVSCNSADEWYLVVRREAPMGTSIEPYDADKDEWNHLFEETKVLVRADLTKSMLMERNAKSAKLLLDVMERRDPDHWSPKPKQTDVTATEGNRALKISITQI